MQHQDTKRKKQIESAIKGLRVMMGWSEPNPKALSNPIVRAILGEATMKEVSEEVYKSIGLPPQIAFIGKTGVGKSTTINELFDPNPHLPVDHIEPATITMEIRKLSLGDRGELFFVDCPGLGAGETIDERNISAYKTTLENCDVAVWIIKADDRTMGIDQAFVKRVLPEKLKDRLIVGINQIDKIEPGEWLIDANLPSDEQVESIKRKEFVVRKNFNDIGLEPKNIIAYSAKRHYHLKLLFKSMLEVCPPDRIVALQQSKGEIKSFFEDSHGISVSPKSAGSLAKIAMRFFSLFTNRNAKKHSDD